jgi:hypothetical protein
MGKNRAKGNGRRVYEEKGPIYVPILVILRRRQKFLLMKKNWTYDNIYQ